MKIPKILAMAKSSHNIELIQPATGEQYIHFKKAVYCISALPKLTAEQLFSMLDVPSDKQSKYIIDIYGEHETIMNFFHASEETSSVYMYNLIISEPGRTLRPIEVDGKCFFIDNAYLAPFDEFFEIERVNNGREYMDPVFAVKSGLITLALIQPEMIDYKDMSSQLMRIAGRMCPSSAED